MTAEQTTRNHTASIAAALAAPHGGQHGDPDADLHGDPPDANLRERLSEFRALLVISLLMTESVNEDQILELAASSAPGLGPWRIDGYGFTDGQWRPASTGASRPPGGHSRGSSPPSSARPAAAIRPAACSASWPRSAPRPARSACPAGRGPGPTRCAAPVACLVTWSRPAWASPPPSSGS